ncbi:GNAT family N-acetyltransferase [Pseudoroseomonas rhizosphaerae]|uniref:GNAT family N-acetyltransferase n=1 Tax=Teichococcus rhizosphaerae TaxID=1335062 RepID=A0A2C7A9E9_9PROT|nr:GNAT family N-acetyltransferase [Pseudoroseomonas rhizosphaerae]PHK94639.1 GNAT family N-acetyltransferase [Pseudoroseomonas rhizosphaerae]
MPEIRDATEADLPALLAILNQAIRETTAIWHTAEATLEARQAWLRERQGRGLPVLVAVDGGVVRGFASYGDFRPFAGFAATAEHSVYVDPAAQGRGVGLALLEALVARGRAAGLHVMVGAIEAGNAASVALHRKAGFEEAGLLREVGRKFDRWLDLLFMTRRL